MTKRGNALRELRKAMKNGDNNMAVRAMDVLFTPKWQSQLQSRLCAECGEALEAGDDLRHGYHYLEV